jgi:hypothetical protein
VDGRGSFLEGEELSDGAATEVGVEHTALVVRGEVGEFGGGLEGAGDGRRRR